MSASLLLNMYLCSDGAQMGHLHHIYNLFQLYPIMLNRLNDEALSKASERRVPTWIRRSQRWILLTKLICHADRENIQQTHVGGPYLV